MVSSPEGFTNKRPIYPMLPKTVKKPSARTSLCLFTNILEARKKTAIHQVGAAK